MSIIHKDIAAIREDYSKFHLEEKDVAANPIEQFQCWFDQSVRSQVMEPNAMVLSTIGEGHFPSSRVVLLKDIKSNGFSFFTNYDSRKGRAIANCDRVSLLFFWPELQRQVRIEGRAEKLPAEDSDEYFASRPKASQLGALASPQSSIIDDRNFLQTRVDSLENKYALNDEVPRPAYWGGYLVKPVRMEFWQGRSSRLHDRVEYVNRGGDWEIHRLAP
ncbi:MAG: pyridoxamine 5'-phosphate oxidase [Sphingobacterium sp.]|uniref:pyridoxamine 5'-phosphate oxidase n=1 Tax=Sphingobacterium sp. JB170 TaxID=1434842 RepID=UPI00097F417B|nr:pyridoxamine 5'-phosphate oxidase [Sphingobacterium sp. JB170]SJN48476.1 Pyridoxamine 5'-phosphate oxidase [Sphingobacterium sp. JB170]